MSAKLKNSFPRFKTTPDSNLLKVEEGDYFTTRGGWLARILYINNIVGVCYAVHNPGTQYEIGPILHERDTGYSISLMIPGMVAPPAYEGHPADLIKKVKPT